MRLGIGLGLFKAGLISAGVRIFSAFQTRVIGDGGTVEAGTCVVNGINGSALLQKASLLLIPSGYKGGRLYSQIPTNGNGDLTWTRGSDAFRTNASGLLQRVPWNLFTYSEAFTNSAWLKSNATITADTITAPNGTLTADTVAFTTGGYVVQSFTNNGLMTFSLYAKYIATRWLCVENFNSVDKAAWFDLQNGVVGSTINGATSTITNVGDGWYRCAITMTAVSSSSSQYAFFTVSADSSFTRSGSAYFWGAQLVEGTTAQTYLPTTDRLNFPRLSYMYGSCPSVLLEPQRTNLLTYSNTPTDSSWSKLGLGAGTAPVVTANAGTSPEGMNNATRVQFNCGGTTSSDRSILQKPSISLINATNYAASIYVKAYSSGEVGKQLRFIQEGVTSQSIITLTDSWQRVAITGTSATTTSNYIIETRGGTTTNTTADVLIYGAQLELGAYPTTYIPTTSATATRVADSFSRNNIYTNGLISASGGTWFVELRGNVAYVRDTAVEGLFLGSDSLGTTNSFLISAVGGGGRLRINKYVSSVFTQLYLTTTDTTKIAIKWNGSTADVFVNGTKQVSATAFTATQLQFLAHSTNGDVPKFIQQMALFPEPKSDQFCIDLTT